MSVKILIYYTTVILVFVDYVIFHTRDFQMFSLFRSSDDCCYVSDKSIFIGFILNVGVKE